MVNEGAVGKLMLMVPDAPLKCRLIAIRIDSHPLHSLGNPIVQFRSLIDSNPYVFPVHLLLFTPLYNRYQSQLNSGWLTRFINNQSLIPEAWQKVLGLFSNIKAYDKQNLQFGYCSFFMVAGLLVFPSFPIAVSITDFRCFRWHSHTLQSSREAYSELAGL